MTNGIASTKGHLASNGGLRGHSVGIYFPCIMSKIGTFEDMKELVITPTGQAVLDTWDEATALAVSWKLRRLYRSRLPNVLVYDVLGCSLYEDEYSVHHVKDDAATFFGVYVRDSKGHAVWVCDTKTRQHADNVVKALQEMPV